MIIQDYLNCPQYATVRREDVADEFVWNWLLERCGLDPDAERTTWIQIVIPSLIYDQFIQLNDAHLEGQNPNSRAMISCYRKLHGTRW